MGTPVYRFLSMIQRLFSINPSWPPHARKAHHVHRARISHSEGDSRSHLAYLSHTRCGSFLDSYGFRHGRHHAEDIEHGPVRMRPDIPVAHLTSTTDIISSSIPLGGVSSQPRSTQPKRCGQHEQHKSLHVLQEHYPSKPQGRGAASI